MKKVPLVFIALAAAAGAVYYFNPRHGGRRRRETVDALLGWRDAPQRQATDHAGDLRTRVSSLANGLWLLLDRWSERRASGDELAHQVALEPLSWPGKRPDRIASSSGRFFCVCAVGMTNSPPAR